MVKMVNVFLIIKLITDKVDNKEAGFAFSSWATMEQAKDDAEERNDMHRMLNKTYKTLKDWLPYGYDTATIDPKIEKHLDDFITVELDSRDKHWIGKHKNVLNWCMLNTGYAVGFNESPSRGWSFVIVKIK